MGSDRRLPCLAAAALCAAAWLVVQSTRREGGVARGHAVLLDDAAEIAAEHRALALKRIHTRKLHKLRLMARQVEDDPDVHILKHEDRTLDAIKQLGSAKSMHLDLTRLSAGSGPIPSDSGGPLPGKNERAPTTVAAVAQIARKAGVKISAKVTKSEEAKAAAMIEALMKSAKTKIHKVRSTPKAVFHRKMKQAMFDYKLYKGRKGHVTIADAQPKSPLAKMLGYKDSGHEGSALPAQLRDSLDPKAAAAAKKADFHAKMAAALLAYQRYTSGAQGGGAASGDAQPAVPVPLVTGQSAAQPQVPRSNVMLAAAGASPHSKPEATALEAPGGWHTRPAAPQPTDSEAWASKPVTPLPTVTQAHAKPSYVVDFNEPSLAGAHATFHCGQSGCEPAGLRSAGGGMGALGAESAGGVGNSIERQERLTWGGHGGKQGSGALYTCDQDGCKLKGGKDTHQQQAAAGSSSSSSSSNSGSGFECDQSGCHELVKAAAAYKNGVLVLGLEQVPD